MTRMKQMQVIATDLQAVKNLEKQECLMIVATKNQRLKELVNVPIKATGLHSNWTKLDVQFENGEMVTISI